MAEMVVKAVYDKMATYVRRKYILSYSIYGGRAKTIHPKYTIDEISLYIKSYIEKDFSEFYAANLHLKSQAELRAYRYYLDEAMRIARHIHGNNIVSMSQFFV